MAEFVRGPYTHNLVSALYAMRSLIETYLSDQADDNKSSEALVRACDQADQALNIAKRLGSVCVSTRESSGVPKAGRVSLKSAWQQTVGLLKKDFLLAGIEILERIPDPFPFLQCRPKDLREILYHLAKNALEAMPAGAKLVIRAQLSFSTREEAFATIQVADTGPGIPESRLSCLFQPFYSTKSCREGNGLGLYLTQQLVRRNGGRITASSFKGHGTTFTLEFPLSPSKRKRKHT